jgi:hypothetical protein
MSLYLIFMNGVRFWVVTTPQGKRLISRDEAEAIFYRMQAGRVLHD